MASVSDDKHGHTNRLALEKSPYLLQHAANPVDWYPWGAEAFHKAQTENKPIFLSVGYSTCHWCHVMERESFEDAEIGQIMSDNFVCIKVDREERPDVDRVYMTFIQATSGRGGWPMSVWLTPDLKPFVGGTYFPPDDRYHGSPGFKTILRSISKQWKTNREKIEEQGSAILSALSEGTSMSGEGMDLPGPEMAENCCTMLEKSFDEHMGGFGKAPKFPHPANFNFLFRVYADKPSSEAGKKALHMALFTLKMMAKGGMHDHVAQGFHRYSTDKFWHVPHFEKMLYDQGQLAVSYTDAYQISKEKLYSDVTRDILKYVSRDLTDPSGGFYSAEDADSYPSHTATEKTEGAFCVWTHEEITALLSENVDGRSDLTMSQVFGEHFDVKENGNVASFQDPHDELKDKNVLIVKGDVEQTAQHFNMVVPAVEEVIQKSLQILFVQRQDRPRPHLDDKMVAAWNGLMMSGFARAGQVLNDPEYISQAIDTGKFLQNHMYLPDKGILLRTCYAGKDKTVTQIQEPIEGFADDYAFVIRGLLDLYEACYDELWVKWAESLQERQDTLFLDEVGGAYYSTAAGDPNIVLRMKEEQDGAEPSANSVSASNLLRLSSFLDRRQWREQAAQIFNVFSERMTRIPIAMPELVASLVLLRETPKQIIVVGDKSETDTQTLLRCIHSNFLPTKVLILSEEKPDNSFLSSRLKVLSSLEKKEGKATAYVCENYTCSLPVNSVNELQKLLKRSNPHSEL